MDGVGIACAMQVEQGNLQTQAVKLKGYLHSRSLQVSSQDSGPILVKCDENLETMSSKTIMS